MDSPGPGHREPGDGPDGAAPPGPARLARRLGLGDAVIVGLGSMLGAGVFAAFGPAAAAAGTGLLIALALAAVIANATGHDEVGAPEVERDGDAPVLAEVGRHVVRQGGREEQHPPGGRLDLQATGRTCSAVIA